VKRILITGASGDLGRPLSALAAAYGWDVSACYLTNPKIGGGLPYQLDLTNGERILHLIKQFRPNIVIHTAISDRNYSGFIPVTAENLVRACRKFGARLIAISTDMVFDGKNPPYTETSAPTPISEYGRAKAQSEELLLSGYQDSLVVRTSLLYDFESNNRQLKWMLDRIKLGEKLQLYTDEIRSPINTWNLAECLLELADTSQSGILNVAGPAPVSRYDYGCQLLTGVGIDPRNCVEAVLAAEIAPERPRNLSLDVTQAQSLLKTPLLTVTDALQSSLRIKASEALQRPTDDLMPHS